MIDYIAHFIFRGLFCCFLPPPEMRMPLRHDTARHTGIITQILMRKDAPFLAYAARLSSLRRR